MPMLKIKFSYLSIEKIDIFITVTPMKSTYIATSNKPAEKLGNFFCKLVSNIQICFPSYLLLKEEDKENPGVYDFHTYTADKICSGSVMSKNKLIFEKSIIQYSSNPSQKETKLQTVKIFT